MTNTNEVQRNELGDAYQHAEDLYDNAGAMSQLLDIRSRSCDMAPEFGPKTAYYIFGLLSNAKASLDRLDIALAPFLPSMGENQ